MHCEKDNGIQVHRGMFNDSHEILFPFQFIFILQQKRKKTTKNVETTFYFVMGE